MVRPLRVVAILVVVCLAPLGALAAEPFRYPQAKAGKGELKYVENVPVLTVQGTSDEIGGQLGELGLKPISELFNQVDAFLKSVHREASFPILAKMGGLMALQFPKEHLAELDAAAKSSGLPRDRLVLANVITDLMKIGGCSTLVVEPELSATGGPLFGRNLDWPPFANLAEATLVIVCRPDGKHAFASVTFPGVVGCLSGMNDTGLSLAMLVVNRTNDKSARFNPLGVPNVLVFRRILEECSTVDEAEKLLRSVRPTTMFNLAVCDTAKGVVFEVTTKTVALRSAEQGMCACTNHFRTDDLAVDTSCGRYATLDKFRGQKNVGVSDVARQLDAVNQGSRTLQSMIFEPKARKLHLAFGPGPASRLPLTPIELAPLMKKEQSR